MCANGSTDGRDAEVSSDPIVEVLISATAAAMPQVIHHSYDVDIGEAARAAHQVVGEFVGRDHFDRAQFDRLYCELMERNFQVPMQVRSVTTNLVDHILEYAMVVVASEVLRRLRTGRLVTGRAELAEHANAE